MMCLDASTGNTIWQHKIGGIHSPAVSGDYLFMISNMNELLCLNRHNGSIHWVRHLPRFVNEEKHSKPVLWAGPILVNTSLVLSGSNGEAMMVSIQDGSEQARIDLGHKTLLSPIAVDNTVMFLTDRAELIAFK